MPLPRGFAALVAAQFMSALADNALLIVAIALLQRDGLPGWWAPLLKVGFTLSYVLLAPFVGPLADAFVKGRVMAAMNGVKVIGVLLLAVGMHPVAALTVVGFGAAAYAPAKYGLVTELVAAEQLVAANAWLEVTVVCAALLGVAVGGALVSPWWLQATGGTLATSLAVLLGLYALAAVLTLGVPDSGARYARAARHPADLLRNFTQANRTLWRDGEGGLALAATTIFWGVGATLQFAVLRWAVEVLGLTLDRAAYLQAAVAVGVVVLLAIVGAAGGFMVVPLNALLQHRGCSLLTAGRSIAVQGFNENLSVLAMLAGYAVAQAWEVPIVPTLWAFGLAVSLAIALLIVYDRRSARPSGR